MRWMRDDERCVRSYHHVIDLLLVGFSHRSCPPYLACANGGERRFLRSSLGLSDLTVVTGALVQNDAKSGDI